LGGQKGHSELSAQGQAGSTIEKRTLRRAWTCVYAWEVSKFNADSIRAKDAEDGELGGSHAGWSE
jgi:hypothetical protein